VIKELDARIDYCDSLLAAAARCKLDRLQSVLNADVCKLCIVLYIVS